MSEHLAAMFLLLLFLSCINVAYVTKIEDVLICVNDTDCNESTDSIAYTQSPNINDSTLEDSSNDTAEDNSYTTNVPTETTTFIKEKLNVTEQPELQSTVPTISPPNIIFQDNKTVTLERKEICECDLTVRIDAFNFI